MWGCGRTLRPSRARNSAGPMWSRKTKGPTRRRLILGRARRTEKPPRSLLEGSIITSAVADGRPAAGGRAARKLMRAPIVESGGAARGEARWGYYRLPPDAALRGEAIHGAEPVGAAM